MSAGFYKIDNNELLYSPTTVENTDYYLTFESPHQYTYPVDGWYWFDSLEEANSFFGIDRDSTTHG